MLEIKIRLTPSRRVIAFNEAYFKLHRYYPDDSSAISSIKDLSHLKEVLTKEQLSPYQHAYLQMINHLIAHEIATDITISVVAGC